VVRQLSNSRVEVSPARAAAFDILLRVERESSFASELLHSLSRNQLTTADHALMTELVMGVLRWRSLLDSGIAKVSSQPLSKLDLEILTALRMGMYQLRWLTRIPQHAAINESVELVKRARKRSASSFVNAVLRKIAAVRHSSHEFRHAIENASGGDLATVSAHPGWLVDRWINLYGLESARQICLYNQSVPGTAIRLIASDGKSSSEIDAQLLSEGIELAPGELLASARRVLRGDITRTAAFRNGHCAIQDEASQLVATLVGHGQHILDCCAAPGGKTAVIAISNPTAHIVAVELHPHRARLLKRLLRSHLRNNNESQEISIVCADAGSLPFSAKFDHVLADVPCSGTGTLSRNPEIKWRLRPEDLTDLQSRQIAILRSVMDQVARGGRLIYSTCSLEKEENQDVIGQCLAQDTDFHVIDCRIELDRLTKQKELVGSAPDSLTSGTYLRTLPGIHACDGFFAAILEKR
jgi:16S rRNA (cytosine967-C5)-methyltransferase